MEGIRRALVISILSRGWAAALTLLAVPLYLRLLGVEAYGVVGLFTSFSILVGFLDLGLGATLTRELARLSAKTSTLADSRDLLRTFELTYALIALLIGLLVTLASGPVAQHWVQAQVLERSAIAHALTLAGVALACQWPTNLYNAGLSGIHKQAQLGIATIVFSTFRVVLTLATLCWSPSLDSFFWAQICSMLLQALGTRLLLWRALELKEHRPRLRISIIRSSLRFAGGMTGIAITSIILTQTDKVILSKALNLMDFGVYIVAGTLATGLYMLISPMFSVMYPRFSSIIHAGDNSKLIDLYHTSSQIMAALIVPIALVVAVFAQEVLYVWTGDAGLSQQAALTLGFLIVGNALNGLMNLPFAIQLAFGWTSLAFWLNIAFIATLAPTIWWSATHYGATGAAAVWLVLNFLCLLIVPQLMHRLILPNQKKTWYWNGIIIPLLVSTPLALMTRSLITADARAYIVIYMILSWMLLSAAVILALPRTRLLALRKISSWRSQCKYGKNLDDKAIKKSSRVN